MKKIFLTSLLVGIIVMVSLSSLAQQPIPNYSDIDKSMKPLEGALDSSLENVIISYGYVPTVGSIFTCKLVFNEITPEIKEKIVQLVKALGPLIQINENENIIIILKSSGGFLGGSHEYVIVAPKSKISDTQSWIMYDSSIKE